MVSARRGSVRSAVGPGVVTIVLCALTAACAVSNRAERPPDPAEGEVLGTMVLGIVPVRHARMPAPPIDLTLHVKRLPDGNDLNFDIADGRAVWDTNPVPDASSPVGANFQNFRLRLPPGDYVVRAIDVRARSLSRKRFTLPTGEQRFTVSEGGCAYIGRITSMHLRLPPGTFADARTTAGEASALQGRPVLMLYLIEGALVSAGGAIDLPKADEASRGQAYSKEMLDYASGRNCAVALAR